MDQATTRGKRANGDSANDPPPNDGSRTGYKRRRIALACTSCRNRKSRCNGVRPVCSMCLQMGFDCIYEQPSNPHTQAQPRLDNFYEDRLRSIEEALRLLATQQQNSRSNGESARAPFAPQDPSETTTGETAVLDDDGYLLSTSVDTVDGLATLGESNTKDVRYFGPSSNIALLGDISKLIFLLFQMKGRQRTQPEGYLVSRMPSPHPSATTATPATPANFNTCMLPSEANAKCMIDRFFNDTGMLFPFISKISIVTSYQAARDVGFKGIRRSWLCLLNMIFAFATLTDTSSLQSMNQNIAESRVFFNRVQELLAESKLRLADIELVQCLLLMGQYRQGTHRSDETWSLHGLAVHAATQLGLHCPPNLEEWKDIDIELRKRIWYGCVALDSTLSMTLGRPPSIPMEYIILDPPKPVDLDDLYQPGTGHSSSDPQSSTSTAVFFAATTSLYLLQRRIVAKLFGNNLVRNPLTDIKTLTVVLTEMEFELYDWEQNLNPRLRLKPWQAPDLLESSDTNIVFERLSAIIRLRYLHARIFLHRATLLMLTNVLTNNGAGQEALQGPLTISNIQKSLQLCVQLSSEVIDIVFETSTVPSKLGSWWFSIYYTFHAALILVACQLCHYHQTQHRRLDFTLWSRKEISQAASSLLRSKEAIERIGQGSNASNKICRTLAKMMQLCSSIGRIESESESAVSVDARANEPGVAESLNQSMDAFFPASNQFAPNSVHPQHESSFDAESFEYWMQSDVGIFASLGGFDVGLSGLMPS